MNLALIGCGAIARLHAQRLLADPRARIVDLCDLDLAATRQLRDELTLDARVFSDLPGMLGSCVLDAVVICTPTLLHFDQVLTCRQRGLHVLCEKPLADTRERIVQLIELSRACGPVLSVSYQRRYDAIYRTMRREVQSGRWGPVQSVTTHSAERWQQTIAGTWRDDPQVNPGGFLGDAGSHKIDMLFFVTGLAPVEVFAHSQRRGSRVEIVTTVSGLLTRVSHQPGTAPTQPPHKPDAPAKEIAARPSLARQACVVGEKCGLTDGVALSMNFIGNAQHWREDFHVHCADADLVIREGAMWIARNNLFEKFEDLEPASSPDIAFLDVITKGAPNEAPPDCALPVFDFTQAVLESARTRKIVQLNP
ncbi:MAG: Gfo/Idh/MocA family oxidoreductase [Planctomycetes bacterium]|nr:Gfo/Idh/MocA family oxidoreductase [Planctomycetota bacterium]